MNTMLAAIRTRDLRKVYSSPPPRATGRGFAAWRGRKKQNTQKGPPAKTQPAREVLALDGLSLGVRPGEIFGLLGPNGAGKSTTVGILTTRIQPTGGRAWIGDQAVWRR